MKPKQLENNYLYIIFQLFLKYQQKLIIPKAIPSANKPVLTAIPHTAGAIPDKLWTICWLGGLSGLTSVGLGDLF